jgi:carbon storage regulator
MLVLSRRVREEIHLLIDGEVVAKIILVSSQENKARIGVDAPPEVKIIRQELTDTPKKEGVTL